MRSPHLIPRSVLVPLEILAIAGAVVLTVTGHLLVGIVLVVVFFLLLSVLFVVEAVVPIRRSRALRASLTPAAVAGRVDLEGLVRVYASGGRAEAIDGLRGAYPALNPRDAQLFLEGVLASGRGPVGRPSW